MSKRLLSDEPNTPNSFKELFWENAKKSSYGGILKRQEELQRAFRSYGIPSGSLRMLFMNKPKGNIPKIVTITNGLSKVTGKKHYTWEALSSR